ncbi:hypothetical protein [Pelobacter propionicus]|uniref:hypothetical protein n=1 Tax=Pelobacter propionicus TaxID=29543 RepID=UPI0006746ACA|nr:hypothetical protein [Pelobacter propionicus]
MQQGLVEVDGLEDPGELRQTLLDPQPTQDDGPQGEQQGDEHDPDGGRHAQHAVVDEPEQYRQHHQYGNDF